MSIMVYTKMSKTCIYVCFFLPSINVNHIKYRPEKFDICKTSMLDTNNIRFNPFAVAVRRF